MHLPAIISLTSHAPLAVDGPASQSPANADGGTTLSTMATVTNNARNMCGYVRIHRAFVRVSDEFVVCLSDAASIWSPRSTLSVP